MKTYTTSLLAGLAGVLLSISSHGQVVTHFDIDFDDYASGTLVTSGTAWSYQQFGATPPTVQPASGDKHLSVSGVPETARLVTLTSSTNATTGTQTMNIAPSSSYQWKFSLLLPNMGEVDAPEFAPVLIRLDNGSASARRYLTGLAITEEGQLRYMTNPNVETLSTQMTYAPDSEFLFQTDTWYDVTFDITTSANLTITYDLTITGGSTSFSREGISYRPVQEADPNESSLVLTASTRMVAGRVSNSNELNFHLDNLYLATIPEPGVAGLLLGSTLLGAFMFRKRVRD